MPRAGVEDTGVVTVDEVVEVVNVLGMDEGEGIFLGVTLGENNVEDVGVSLLDSEGERVLLVDEEMLELVLEGCEYDE